MTRKPCCQSSRCETSMMLWEEPKAATSWAMACSDDVACAQLCDSLRAVAQGVEDGVGVRALLGRRLHRDRGARMRRELHRQTDHLDVAQLGMLQWPRDREMAHLRIVEHAV